ncbi:serine/threonine-protein kinase [Pleionea litopenaei]|uniref:Serine/threonine-protein kinase n=1 Tax=Pleionea litopenaei TaxID=3070815 RepID=A0AA51RR59_9GAMM|nr:serine/threonine-protein kinase [Pleionea sp. HL-JVS1]WMS86106.1 serine/threonine-protein kinase [Pleionea sp. HL-JVS1]
MSNSNDTKATQAMESAAATAGSRLTQLAQRLQSQQTTDGFAKAREDVNRALAEKKIILNKRFVLQETLGSGGMGTVYLAQDLRKVEATDLNPYVAIKVLSGDFKNHPDAFIALQREASRSSNLSHPNIVTVYDFDRDNDTVYMTMELLQGEDLDALMRRKQPMGLDKSEAKKIVLDYCRALNYAHQKGIIHCDLKPANIFITAEGAKVLDFGIARLARKTADHFDAGKIGALTPDYASPEMFENAPPDPRDDVFAAAVIAYELFAGKHPFDNKSAMTAKTLGMQPEPISGLNKREWKALSQALALDKEQRTPSIIAFIKQLAGSKKQPLIYTTVALSLVTLSVLGYSIFKAQQRSQKIESTISELKNCQSSGNFECVVDQANTLLGLEPNDEFAKAALENAKLSLIAQQQQLAIEKLLNKGKQCLEQHNFVCIDEIYSDIIKLDSSNVAATELKTQAMELQQALQTQFTELLSEAAACFDRKQYQCAKEKANEALAILPGDALALAMIRDAENAVMIQEQSLIKAQAMVAEGQQCFDKFDYSCAIAKAESAMAFIENYSEAVNLKRRAKAAIAKAKKDIRID